MTAHTPLDRLPTMASSDAKNGFAALLERVLHKPEPVVITRNARPTAVMLSIEAYERLVEAVPDPLAKLTAEFDALVARMQTPAAKSAVDALFTATPEQLGEAAVRGAGRPGH
ncbi:type II toxin-antitoxin system Phd/YefM family antitoxin [Metallibacterium sp.]